jgi:hypothetical protein
MLFDLSHHVSSRKLASFCNIDKNKIKYFDHFYAIFDLI